MNDDSLATVILIWHAERTQDGTDDPELNVVGCARAEELLHVLADAGVTSIVVSRFRRSQQTAEPIATKLPLQPSTKTENVEVIAAIRALPTASVALVVGDSNTVPQIIAGLGGPSLDTLDDAEFDNLFVLSNGRLTHLRYGA
jgi:phosphohistidine phosphatase SixA